MPITELNEIIRKLEREVCLINEKLEDTRKVKQIVITYNMGRIRSLEKVIELLRRMEDVK